VRLGGRPRPKLCRATCRPSDLEHRSLSRWDVRNSTCERRRRRGG
jgi:hypothetical protein